MIRTDLYYDFMEISQVDYSEKIRFISYINAQDHIVTQKITKKLQAFMTELSS